MEYTCVYNKQSNELEMTMLLYFFPLYFWTTTFLLSQCSTRIPNLIVGSSVQVLLTLMYISYSNRLSISLYVFLQIYYNSTDNSGKLLAWFSDDSVLCG